MGFDGTLKNRHLYRPFGEKLQDVVTTADKYGYTSQEQDDELSVDWYYYGARYYDPRLKVFTSVDPLASKYPGWSPYVYTLNNPIKYVDPESPFLSEYTYISQEAHLVGAEFLTIF